MGNVACVCVWGGGGRRKGWVWVMLLVCVSTLGVLGYMHAHRIHPDKAGYAAKWKGFTW